MDRARDDFLDADVGRTNADAEVGEPAAERVRRMMEELDEEDKKEDG